jgi:Protein of unknown function (DUF1822)/NB-ARC domain
MTMDFEEALKVVDAAIYSKAGRHMNAPEETILQGTWHGMTYEQMAETSQYSLNYLMRDIGPKFWRILSEALDEEVSKTNVRIIIERKRRGTWWQNDRSLDFLFLKKERNDADNWKEDSYRQNLVSDYDPATATKQDWGESPDVSAFYGREEEIATLEGWMLDETCQLVVLRSMSGAGKTLTIKKIAEGLQEKFDFIIWRSLSNAPNLRELVYSLLKSLPFPVVQNERDYLSQLLAKLRSKRCLIVLDGVEAILQPNQFAGQYRSGYQDYSELFRRLGEESHQSCLVLTGLENPREISLSEGETSPVRSMSLAGLSEDAVKSLLIKEGLSSQESWKALGEQYQGNPAALKIVAKLIRELFNGNVSEFLEQRAFVFGEIAKLLGTVFNRLSTLEKEILYVLAIETEAVSFTTIQKNISIPTSQGELLEALASLGQRGAIESTTADGKSLFILPAMVKEYVTKELLELIGGSVSDAQRGNSLDLEESIELNPATRKKVNINQWTHSNFEASWQPLEALLASRGDRLIPSLKYILPIRGEDTIKRFKTLRLGKTASSPEVALLLAVREDSDGKLAIRVQAHPGKDAQALPTHLSLALVNDAGEILREVEAKAQETFLQLPLFRGRLGEQFGIQLESNNVIVTEDFKI